MNNKIDKYYLIILITILSLGIVLPFFGFVLAYYDGRMPSTWFDYGNSNHGPWQHYSRGVIILEYHWALLVIALGLSVLGIVIGYRRFIYSWIAIISFLLMLVSIATLFWLID